MLDELSASREEVLRTRSALEETAETAAARWRRIQTLEGGALPDQTQSVVGSVSSRGNKPGLAQWVCRNAEGNFYFIFRKGFVYGKCTNEGPVSSLTRLSIPKIRPKSYTTDS
eukprot:115737-Prymnesium_polylepis.1